MIYLPRFVLYLPQIILFFILLIAVSACSTKEPLSELIVKDGLIYSAGSDKLYNGVVKDKVLERIIEYEVVNGMKEGKFKVFFMNGKIEMSGLMKENKNEGKWSYFYPNGQMESEGLFKNDIAEDTWTWYYESGEVKEKGTFRDGKREGAWTMFDEQGIIIEQAYYLDGRRKTDNQL